jgi:hypothetical protein
VLKEVNLFNSFIEAMHNSDQKRFCVANLGMSFLTVLDRRVLEKSEESEPIYALPFQNECLISIAAAQHV